MAPGSIAPDPQMSALMEGFSEGTMHLAHHSIISLLFTGLVSLSDGERDHLFMPLSCYALAMVPDWGIMGEWFIPICEIMRTCD